MMAVGKEICVACHGSGGDAFAGRCPACRGTGFAPIVADLRGAVSEIVSRANADGTAAPLPHHPADPKQSAGAAKVPMSALPMAVIAELAVAHGEGAAKYGRHNWRKGEVLASTYYAATLRHLTAWFEGEDIDPDSGLSHLVKAMASLAVLRDAQIHGTALDDRPEPAPEGFMVRLCGVHADLQARLSSRSA